MQLKASKEIKNLEEGRAVSFNSSEVDHFEPAGSEKNSWDRQYEKYIKFINLKN
jgi:hypothetical protein